MSNARDSSLPKPDRASPAPATGTDPNGDAVSPPSVNLQVVSPSSQVRSPLSFQFLPATTTVKELKEMIRNTLEVSPSAESQRLIYRGRMLARDSETMTEIIGEETLKLPAQQTFHLVLRPPVAGDVPNSDSSPISSAHPQAHMPGSTSHPPAPRLTSAEHPNNLPPVQLASGPRRLADRPYIPTFPPQNLQANNDLQHRLLLQRIQAQHDEVTESINYIEQQQRLRMSGANLNTNIQPPPLFQTQHQVNAPGPIPHGLQHAGNIPGNQQYTLPIFQNVLAQQIQQGRGHIPQTGPTPNNTQPMMHQGSPNWTQSPAVTRGHTPDQTTTFTRHGVNANGERWQITVNESTTVFPPGNSQHRAPVQTGSGDITSNLQHLLQTAERISAMQARINSLTQRHGAAPSPGNAAPSAPQRPASTPPIGRIARPTPMTTNSFPLPAGVSSTAASSTVPSHDSPVVYIMSSPSGPQALLINNSQTFYSPGHSYITHQTVNGSPAEVRNRRDRPHRHRHRHRDANQPAADGAAPRVPAEQAQNAPPRAQPLRIAIWPHIWLVMRVLLFVWFFTYGNNSSWTRILTIWGIALILFIVNTGVFNETFGAFWNPIRQHLENLLPLAGPNPVLPARIPGQQDGDVAAGAAAAGTRSEPNPEEVARRLLQQRRQQDASWMMTQLRRIEHAVLLFIASIVPGTAERHIEARTMEQNRLLEERRQDAAAAAAAMEPVPADVENETENNNQEGDGEASGTERTEGEAMVVDGSEQGQGQGGSPFHADVADVAAVPV